MSMPPAVAPFNALVTRVDHRAECAPGLRSPLYLLGFGFVAAIWLAYFSSPVAEFYKEWIYAASLAMAALAAPQTASGRRAGAGAPEIWLCGGLAAVLLIQVIVGDGLWPKAVVVAGYLALFVTAQRLGGTLAAQAPARLFQALCWFVVIAALGNCAFSAVQMLDLQLPWPLVAPWSGPRISGNTAQVNHTATLLWMGAAAVLGLWNTRALGRAVSAALLALFAFFAIATGSRMPLVVTLVLGVSGFVIWRRSRDERVRQAACRMAVCAWCLPGVEWLWSLVGLSDLLGLSSGAQRVLNDGGTAEVRRWLLRAAWNASTEHPWLGVGVGRFVHHTYALAVQTGRLMAGSAEMHAHNLVTHIAAELGLPAGLLAVATLVLVLRRVWRCAMASAAGLVLGAMVVVILIHALLEYPLWYAYFLGTLGLLLGALRQWDPALPEQSGAVGSSADHRGLKLLGGGVLVLALLAYRTYAPVERLMQEVQFQIGVGGVARSSDLIRAELASVPAWSPYKDYADTVALITTMPSPANAAAMAASCERLIRFGPSPHLLARCAVAMQLEDSAGSAARASLMASSLCTFFPGSQGLIYQLWNLLATPYPQVLDLRAPCLDIVPEPTRP